METDGIACLLFAAAGLLLAIGTASEHARRHAASVSLAISSAAGLLALATTRSAGDAALLLAAAQLAAVPLLDRARFFGLVAGATTCGYLVLHCVQWFALMGMQADAPWNLLAVLVVSSLAGLVGSALLPPHPHAARHRHGEWWQAAGWLSFAATALVMQFDVRKEAVAAGLAANFAAMLLARHRRAPQPAVDAVLATSAALLMATASSLPLTQAMVLGATTSGGIWWAARLAPSLRLDDPARQIAMLLAPFLLWLALSDLAVADALQWLFALMVAAMLASLAWPVAMFLFGLQASPRRVREGLDFHP